MNLKQFANLAGVTIVDCGPGWHGRYGYSNADAPNCTTCGFKTKQAAREGWLRDTFGAAPPKQIGKDFWIVENAILTSMVPNANDCN